MNLDVTCQVCRGRALQQGVLSYCLTLDPNADIYVKRIFGIDKYAVLDQVDHLPEQLPVLFISLIS